MCYGTDALALAPSIQAWASALRVLVPEVYFSRGGGCGGGDVNDIRLLMEKTVIENYIAATMMTVMMRIMASTMDKEYYIWGGHCMKTKSKCQECAEGALDVYVVAPFLPSGCSLRQRPPVHS